MSGRIKSAIQASAPCLTRESIGKLEVFGGFWCVEGKSG